MSTLILIGAPGSGKSAILSELASMGWTVCDVGPALAARAGVSIEDFYLFVSSDERTKAIRAAVMALLDDVEADPERRWALALPSEALGESLDDEAGSIRDRVASSGATVIKLSADVSTLVSRNGLIGPRSATFLMPRKEFRLMLERRTPVYDALASAEYDTTRTLPRQVAASLDERFSCNFSKAHLP